MRRILNIKRLRIAAWPADWGAVVKALLLAALAIQSARLVWAVVQPVGPIGDWRPAMATPLPLAQRSALIASINPFDRADVTAATANLPSDLKLFGVRDNVSGLGGGAIIGLPDGQQVSVSIGEEIMPGVTLVDTGFDFAEVQRQGGRQRIFLDEDKAPEAVGANGTTAPAPSPAAAGEKAVTLAQVKGGASFQPRQQNGAVTGILVQPGGDAGAFAATGLQAGDVIVSVNGVRIQSAADAAQLQQSLAPGASLALTVERNGQPASLTLKISGNP